MKNLKTLESFIFEQENKTDKTFPTDVKVNPSLDDVKSLSKGKFAILVNTKDKNLEIWYSKGDSRFSIISFANESKKWPNDEKTKIELTGIIRVQGIDFTKDKSSHSTYDPITDITKQSGKALSDFFIETTLEQSNNNYFLSTLAKIIILSLNDAKVLALLNNNFKMFSKIIKSCSKIDIFVNTDIIKKYGTEGGNTIINKFKTEVAKLI